MESLEIYEPGTAMGQCIRELIKDQGVDVCRDKINKRWIVKAVTEAEFGFVRFVQKAQIGRRSLKRAADKYLLHGFVLCRAEVMPKEDDVPETIVIDLVCARPMSQTGRVLLECAEQTAKERGYKYAKLYCIPVPRLKAYYESIEYVKASDVPDFDPNSTSNEEGVKAYVMVKDLR